jgi:oxygen-independent coproporphyrinogen-3 oxidase
LKEIALCTVYNNDKTVETIYFGGGTPSLLQAEALNSILDALHQKFHIDPDAEITLEANPDDISGQLLASWKRMGINRLSIGVQSFFEEDLKWMNRAHTAEQSVNSIVLAQQAGFDNLTIDLIYGSPGLSDEKWEQNVTQAIDFNIPHLSCYALTVEPKTALHSLIAKNKMQDTDPGQQARQFMQLISWLENAGYEHYEISNFSLPGKRSRHNTAYWQSKPYYGFGPSAHSFNGTDTRSWNIANNALYIQSLLQNIIPAEKERLTTVQKLNEYIMTSLRTIEGIDLNYIQNRFGATFTERLLAAAQPYNEKLIMQNNCVKLTNAGKLFADGIAAGLFEDELLK